MITAEEARRISRESGEDIDVSTILNELDGKIRNAAAKGSTSIYVLKISDEIANKCDGVTSLEKLHVAMNMIEGKLKSLGYDAKVVGPLSLPQESTCLYQINISWKTASSEQTKHLDPDIQAFFSRFWNIGLANKSSES